jgi:hypothetical protein
MTHGRNAPTGWAAFRALRQTPAPISPRRHGNWKHGHFAKGDPMAKLRFLWARAVLDGRWNGPPPWPESAPPPGWSAYRAGR